MYIFTIIYYVVVAVNPVAPILIPSVAPVPAGMYGFGNSYCVQVMFKVTPSSSEKAAPVPPSIDAILAQVWLLALSSKLENLNLLLLTMLDFHQQ